jgi:hypothetical protein
MAYLSFFVLQVILIFSAAQNLTLNGSNPWPKSNPNSFRIVTASCNYQHYHTNPLFKIMVRLEPDIIVLLGDNVYLDQIPCDSCIDEDDISCFNYCWSEVDWFKNPLPQYYALLNHTDFTLNRRFSNYDNWPPTILATWDDHDYCYDNADGSCSWKNDTKKAFLYYFNEIDKNNVFDDFINEATNTPDRGIYYYYDLTYNDLTFRFYMLDVRWYRTAESILGSEQSLWFESLIFNNSDNIDYHIVTAGTVFMPHFDLTGETWSRLSREWFLNVTQMAGIQDRMIMFSGDVHYSALYRSNTIFEMVTSSMTHSVPDWMAVIAEQDTDDNLVTDIINGENIGVLDIDQEGFVLTYIDKDANPIVNVTYQYSTDHTSVEVLEDDEVQGFDVSDLTSWLYSSGSIFCPRRTTVMLFLSYLFVLNM